MKEIKTDIIEFTIGSHNLPALINGDFSGMTDSEKMQFEFFEQKAVEAAKKTGAKHWHWAELTECTNYAKCDISGLYSDCSDVALVLMF